MKTEYCNCGDASCDACHGGNGLAGNLVPPNYFTAEGKSLCTRCYIALQKTKSYEKGFEDGFREGVKAGVTAEKLKK